MSENFRKFTADQMRFYDENILEKVNQIHSSSSVTIDQITPGAANTIAQVNGLGTETVFGLLINANITPGTIQTSSIGDDQITPAKVSFINDSLATTNGFILVADGTEYVGLAMSGDGTVGAGGVFALAVNSVTTTKIADNNVTVAKIVDASLADQVLLTSAGTVNPAWGYITAANITDANITTAKIADNNVTVAKIEDASLADQVLLTSAGTVNPAWGYITTANITDANITTAKIADNNVTVAKIEDASSADQVLLTAVGTTNPAWGKITSANLADNTIIPQNLYYTSTNVTTSPYSATSADYILDCYDSAEVINLPAASTFELGQQLIIINAVPIAGRDITVNCDGGDVIYRNNGVGVASYIIPKFTTLIIYRVNPGVWHMYSFSAQQIDFVKDTMSFATSGHLLVTDGTGFTNVALSGDATISSGGALTIANNAVTTAKILDDNVTAPKISFVNDSLAVTDTHFLVANGAQYNNVAMSGDATLANTGALTIANNAITTAKILDDNVTAPKISFVNDSLAVTDTHFLVANGAQYNNVAMSGDATLANTGALTIANGAITTAKLADDSVDGFKLRTPLTNVASSPYTVLTTDFFLYLYNSASVVNIPDSTSFSAGQEIIFFNQTASPITINTFGGGQVFYPGTATTYSLQRDELLSIRKFSNSWVFQKLSPAQITFINDSLAATDTHIMVANGTTFTNVAVSGDATLANTGALTIANNAITTAKILDDNVTTAKLANAPLANQVLTTSEDEVNPVWGYIIGKNITDNTVTVAKIEDASLADQVLLTSAGTVNPAWGYVDSANIASNAITTAKIADDNVTLAKIVDASLNDQVLLTSAGTVNPAWGYVDSANIASNAITTSKIADDNVTVAKIVDASLNDQVLLTSAGTVNPAWGYITNANITDDTIQRQKIAYSFPSVAKTGTYNLQENDWIIKSDTSAGNVTIQLPTPSTVPGKIYTVKNTSGAGANNLILARAGAENIEGVASNYTIATIAQYAVVQFASDGTDWHIINRYL